MSNCDHAYDKGRNEQADGQSTRYDNIIEDNEHVRVRYVTKHFKIYCGCGALLGSRDNPEEGPYNA